MFASTEADLFVASAHLKLLSCGIDKGPAAGSSSSSSSTVAAPGAAVAAVTAAAGAAGAAAASDLVGEANGKHWMRY